MYFILFAVALKNHVKNILYRSISILGIHQISQLSYIAITGEWSNEA